MTQLVQRLERDPAWSVLIAFQLFVFLFTVTRFYWGTIRYQEEVPEVRGTPHLVLGLVGAVLVFSIFYVTGLLVKHPGVFYWSLCLALFIDLLWFVIVGAVLEMPSEIHKIWSWYKLFDVLTLAPLVVLIAVGYIWPGIKYVCDWLSLAAVAGIGIWDVCKFWAYYTKESDWRETLPGHVGS